MGYVHNNNYRKSFTGKPMALNLQIPATSCYRTGGSVPVPKQTKEKVKRRIKLHRYKEDCIDEDLVGSESSSDFISEHLSLESLTRVTVTRVGNSCDQKPMIVFADVRECSPPPPPPKSKPEQSCKKHTRCHCDLLSLGTDSFHTIS